MGAALHLAMFTAQLFAAPVFLDGFESPNLLTTQAPTGAWHDLDLHFDGGLFSTPAARFSGARGLRLVDVDARPGGSDETGLYYTLDAGSREWMLQAWVRPAPTSDAGLPLFLQLFNPSRSLCEVGLVVESGQVVFRAYHDLGTQVFSVRDVLDGGWHLFECWADGVGMSSGGQVKAWVDLALVGAAPLRLQGAVPTALGVGQPYSYDRRFEGSIDFDDVTLADGLAPSHLEVTTTAPGAVGSCVGVTVKPKASSQDAVKAVRTERLELTLTGATLFEDVACTRPAVDAPTLPSGSSQLDFGLELDAVTAMYRIGTPTLFAASGTLSATAADAGSGPLDGGQEPVRARELGVGCACSTGSPLEVLALLLCARALRRRARPAR